KAARWGLAWREIELSLTRLITYRSVHTGHDIGDTIGINRLLQERKRLAWLKGKDAVVMPASFIKDGATNCCHSDVCADVEVMENRSGGARNECLPGCQNSQTSLKAGIQQMS
ncbi:MAG TPA: hypothetical protein VGQ82_05920, partial [Chthoniobacterales bacterium]|nr:hypothetical protein [Chthoniobacterales bacterium]